MTSNTRAATQGQAPKIDNFIKNAIPIVDSVEDARASISTMRRSCF